MASPRDPSELIPASATAAGVAGVVPAPPVGSQRGSLRGDGLWRERNYTTTTAATAYVVLPTDEVIFITGSGARAITAPSAVAFPGREITFMDAAGNAGSGTITITPTENVNGAATTTIAANYGFKTIKSNGAVWFVVG